jgi:hypothetical protein
MSRIPFDVTLTSEVAEIRHAQIAQQAAAVGMGIGPHAPLSLGGKICEFLLQSALVIE